MVNGESRNWIRFLITLSAFHAKYGNWPTRIRVYSFFIEELKQKLSASDFVKLSGKLQFIEDNENPFFATDDYGNRIDYSEALRMDERPEYSNPREWLGIEEPDYYD